MPDKTIEGQEPESPTGAVAEPGQELKTETPAVDLTDSIVNAALKAGESAASEEPETDPETDPNAAKDEKPLPYDQDPKWLAARAAEKSLQEILDDNEIGDVDELKAMLRSGMTIKEIVGDRDAKQLIQDADTLKKYNEYWAEQKRVAEEADLDPDEKAELYKKRLDDYKRQRSDDDAGAEKIKAGKVAIEDYSNRVDTVIEKHELAGDAAEMGRLIAGVDNPFNTVDIFDKKAVAETADAVIAKYVEFRKKDRQAAIDDYAAGKSKIIPIAPTETPSGDGVVKKPLPENASVEETFSAARDELLGLLSGGASP